MIRSEPKARDRAVEAPRAYASESQARGRARPVSEGCEQ